MDTEIPILDEDGIPMEGLHTQVMRRPIQSTDDGSHISCHELAMSINGAEKVRDEICEHSAMIRVRKLSPDEEPKGTTFRIVLPDELAGRYVPCSAASTDTETADGVLLLQSPFVSKSAVVKSHRSHPPQDIFHQSHPPQKISPDSDQLIQAEAQDNRDDDDSQPIQFDQSNGIWDQLEVLHKPHPKSATVPDMASKQDADSLDGNLLRSNSFSSISGMKSVDDEETIEETVEMIDQMISHLKASSPDKTTSLHVKPEQVTLPLVELSKTLQESGQPIDDKEEEASRPPPERSPDDAYHEIELTNTTVAKEQITDQDEGKAVTDTDEADDSTKLEQKKLDSVTHVTDDTFEQRKDLLAGEFMSATSLPTSVMATDVNKFISETAITPDVNSGSKSSNMSQVRSIRSGIIGSQDSFKSVPGELETANEPGQGTEV